MWTHCFEVAGITTEKLPRKAIHFTADGIRAVVAYEDGIDYEILVKPLKKNLPQVCEETHTESERGCEDCRFKGLLLCIDQCHKDEGR